MANTEEQEFINNYDMSKYDRPSLTADVIVFRGESVLMVRRKNHPSKHKLAFPGGFVENGESAERAAVRELKEETGLDVTRLKQLCFVSTPHRDPRGWITTVVFTATSEGEPFAADDALEAAFFSVKLCGDTLYVGDVASKLNLVYDLNGDVDINNSTCDDNLAFDHAKILAFALKRRKDEEKQLQNS